MSICDKQFSITPVPIMRLRISGYADGMVRMFNDFSSSVDPPRDGTMPVKYDPGAYPDPAVNSKNVWDALPGFTLPKIVNPNNVGGCNLNGLRGGLLRAIVYWDVAAASWFFGFDGDQGGYNWKRQVFSATDPTGVYAPFFFECPSTNLVIEAY